MIDEYKAAGVKPRDVWTQSFNIDDVRYWIDNGPSFGRRAVYLDGRYNDPEFDHTNPSTWSPTMEELVADGVEIIAPPLRMLVGVNADGAIGVCSSGQQCGFGHYRVDY